MASDGVTFGVKLFSLACLNKRNRKERKKEGKKERGKEIKEGERKEKRKP